MGAVVYMAPARAELVEQTDSWQADEAIDINLHALVAPVWRPVDMTFPSKRGAPLNPSLYKQEPPGAQEDFRPKTTPVTTAPGIPPSAPPSTSPSQPGGGDSPMADNLQNQQPPAPPPPEVECHLVFPPLNVPGPPVLECMPVGP